MSDAPKIAAIVLAAGRSIRMGDVNKLLAGFDGEPMLARALAQVEATGIEPIYVVIGHQAEDVRAVLSGHDVRFVHNENYQNGLSASVIAGVSAVGDNIDGVLIILGDMPLVGVSDIAALVAAFKGRADICLPVWKGKRGNPVLWGREYFAELQELEGDKGARELLQEHSDRVVEVEMSGDGILRDVDTAGDLDKMQKPS